MPLSSSDFERAERRIAKGQRAGYGGVSARRRPAIADDDDIEIEDIPLQKRRAVISEEAESAQIARNRQEPKAQQPHAFQLAQWATDDGQSRCRLCGEPERVDANDDTLLCTGTAPTDAAPAKSEGPPVPPPDQPAGGEGAAEMTVVTKYTEGLMHAHLGMWDPHFHAVRKDASETGVVTDAKGVELATPHAHPVTDGVLKDGASAEALVAARDETAVAAPVDPPTPARKSIRDLLPLLGAQEQIGEYRVVKAEGDGSDPEHRVSIGIVYPVDREDAHGDSMSKDEVRKAAWAWARKGFSASGTQHKSGTQGAGTVLESWLWPDGAPDWQVKREDGSEDVVKSGDWLAAVSWDEPTWDAIKKGTYTGYSLQGMGKRVAQD